MNFRLIIEPQEGYTTLAVARQSLETGFRVSETRVRPTIEDILRAVARELVEEDIPYRSPLK